MRKSGLPPIAWALTGLLVVSAFIISLGQQDTKVDPQVSSYAPSGLSAFANLLKDSGVQVVVDQRPKPRLGRNDVAVLFQVRNPFKDAAILNGSQDQQAEYRHQFIESVRNGATGIIIPLDSDYMSASRQTLSTNPHLVKNLFTGETYRITSTAGSPGGQNTADFNSEGVPMTLWSDEAEQGRQVSEGFQRVPSLQEAFLTSYKIGDGTVLVAKDGIGVTNRFIDKEDNARAFASAVRVLGSGKRVVFEEASFGNVREPGLIETIGAWANAAWIQLLFLGLVVLYTLGKRFGLAEDLPATQRGARELLDGMADTFRRARSTNVALSTAWVRADADVRRILKLPRDATRSERDRLIPVGLQNAMARLEAASHIQHIPQDDALDLIKRVQFEMDAFLGPHRVKVLSHAKLKA